MTFKKNVSNKIPIKVFIASFLPRILTPNINKGMLKTKFISHKGVLKILLRTIARPVSPPDAIIYGSKNILSPTDIIKHPNAKIISSKRYLYFLSFKINSHHHPF